VDLLQSTFNLVTSLTCIHRLANWWLRSVEYFQDIMVISYHAFNDIISISLDPNIRFFFIWEDRYPKICLSRNGLYSTSTLCCASSLAGPLWSGSDSDGVCYNEKYGMILVLTQGYSNTASTLAAMMVLFDNALVSPKIHWFRSVNHDWYFWTRFSYFSPRLLFWCGRNFSDTKTSRISFYR
jgi:hypothetical protein